MRARMYALKPGAKPRREPTGQALRVLQELRAEREPRTALDIDKAIAESKTPHKTRQDSLRVTLYYLLVFKKQGIVAATEQPEPVEDEAATDAVGAETDETADEGEEAEAEA